MELASYNYKLQDTLGDSLAQTQSDFLIASLLVGIIAMVQVIVPVTVFWTKMAPLTCNADGKRYYCIAAMTMWSGHLCAYAFAAAFWPLTYINQGVINTMYYYVWRYLGEPVGMLVHVAIFFILIGQLIEKYDTNALIFFIVYTALEASIGFLYYTYKNDAWEYLYLGGMRWDPLGRTQETDEDAVADFDEDTELNDF